MKRGIWITLAALLAFAAILVARLPASWIIPAGPKAQFSCASIDGSLWNGGCAGLRVARTPVGDLSWELHPQRLFAGRLAAHVTLLHAAAHAVADLEVGMGQHLVAHNLVADLPLDPKLIPGLPPDLHGRAHLDLPLLEVENGIITQVQGRLEAHDLEDRAGRVTALGSYAVTFPGGTPEPTGQVHDLDGPLAVTGTLRLTRAGGFDLSGMVAARAGASPELTDNIRYLGSPDAAGRRPFALTGSF